MTQSFSFVHTYTPCSLVSKCEFFFHLAKIMRADAVTNRLWRIDDHCYTYTLKAWWIWRENLNTSKKASNPPSWTKKCLWATVRKHFHGEKKESWSSFIARQAALCRTEKKSVRLLLLFMTRSCLLNFSTISPAKFFNSSTSSVIRAMFAAARNCTLKQFKTVALPEIQSAESHSIVRYRSSLIKQLLIANWCLNGGLNSVLYISDACGIGQWQKAWFCLFRCCIRSCSPRKCPWWIRFCLSLTAGVLSLF